MVASRGPGGPFPFPASPASSPPAATSAAPAAASGAKPAATPTNVAVAAPLAAPLAGPAGIALSLAASALITAWVASNKSGAQGDEPSSRQKQQLVADAARNFGSLLQLPADATDRLATWLHDKVTEVATWAHAGGSGLPKAVQEFTRSLQSWWQEQRAGTGVPAPLGRPRKEPGGARRPPPTTPVAPGAMAAPGPASAAAPSPAAQGAAATGPLSHLNPRERSRAVLSLSKRPPTSAVQRTLRALGVSISKPEVTLTGTAEIAGHFGALMALRREIGPRAWGGLTQAGLGHEVTALQTRLKALQEQIGASASGLMERGAALLYAGRPLTAGERGQLTAIAVQLEPLRQQIQSIFTPLHDAGLYAGSPHHPIARQIERFLRQIDRLTAAVPPRAEAPVTAASLAAVPPGGATPKVPGGSPFVTATESLQTWVRALAEGHPGALTAAAYPVRRALQDPAVRAALMAPQATTPSGAPLPPDDPQVATLIRTLAAGLMSLPEAAGLIGPDPTAPGSLPRAALIAMLVNAATPTGGHWLTGAATQALASGVETGLRQHAGLEPVNAAALAARMVLGGAAGALADRLAAAVARHIDGPSGRAAPAAGSAPPTASARPLLPDPERAEVPSPGELWARFLAAVRDTHPAGVHDDLALLTPAQRAALHGDGAAPASLARVAEAFPGFSTFAARQPAQARTFLQLATFLDHHDRLQFVLTRAREGFGAAAARFADRLPRIAPQAVEPDYLVIQPGPRTPAWFPRVLLQPRPALDPNSAFHQPALSRSADGTQPPSALVNLTAVPRPEQLLFDGHQALPDARQVLVWRGHGTPWSAGYPTERAAAMVADEVLRAANEGASIRYVVLQSCHQRDRRVCIGGSNAQAFERRLNAMLRDQDAAPVTVLAAEQPGPIDTTLPTDAHRSRVVASVAPDQAAQDPSLLAPVRFTPARTGARRYDGPMASPRLPLEALSAAERVTRATAATAATVTGSEPLSDRAPGESSVEPLYRPVR